MSLRGALLSGWAASLLVAAPAWADDATTNGASGHTHVSTAADLVEEATTDEADGKLEQAANHATAALALDPKNAAAFDLRGSVYLQQKFWNLAERDFTTLTQLSDDPAYRYKLAQIKFLQRQYDDARPLFAVIKNDPRFSDLARYKVFICDLLGAHEATAAQDLTMLDATGEKPSYYYGRAMWDLDHGNSSEANHLAAVATGKFSTTICALYMEAYHSSRLFNPLVATFTSKDGQKFDQAKVFLENDGLRASTQDGWVTIPITELPDDLSPFPAELRNQITLRRQAAAPSAAGSVPISFTTKSGKSYSQVRWTLEDSGLLILTTNGWLTIPFHELPNNLSSFPPDLQKQIAIQRREAAESLSLNCTVSFTTKHGKKFDAVRAWLDDGGVAVMTPDGPLVIPLAELPDDLSAFLVDWQKQITARRNSQAGDAAAVATISFTTKKGVSYHDVRASVSNDGVMVLTPSGWVTVPLADLPADLSSFPPSWRPLIEGGLKSSTTDTSLVRVVSFDTKRGKHFDQVRAWLDDKGLDVMSPSGWVVIAYDQLPDDLSPFPATWRTTISERQKGAARSQH